MKIGVSSYSFQRLLNGGMTYFDMCEKAARMGYAGVEFIDLDLAHGRGEGDIPTLALALRAHCDSLGLDIPAYTVGADFLNGRGGDAAGEPARVMGCVDIACLLGAKVLRHDAFWSMPGYRDWRGAAERSTAGIRQVADYAQAKGVTTCTENHGLIMQDSDRVAWLINRVGHANYGWLVDIGNFLCADESPSHAVGVAAPYAVHAHVKDFLFKPGTCDTPRGPWMRTRGGNFIRGTVVGDGVVPVRQCAAILKAAGYDGYLSVEFEGAEDVLPALENAAAYLRDIGI